MNWRALKAVLLPPLLLLLLLVGLAAALPLRAADAYLDDAAAFKLSAHAVDAQHIALRFDVAPGYHLYRDRIRVTGEPAAPSSAQSSLGTLQRPEGQREHDANFDQDVQVYRGAVTLLLPLRAAPTAAFKLLVSHQGCADQGLCYPPSVQAFKVAPAAGGTLALTALSEEPADASPLPPPAANVVKTLAASAGSHAVDGVTNSAVGSSVSTDHIAADSGRYARLLASRSLWAVCGAFALAGLLLSFTPCVLPMIPILSSIIVGQGGAASRAQGFALALTYSLGMALVYTTFGMAAGLMGEGLAAALQNAWVLGAFALLLVALSLSMFGVYELQMPAALQGRLTYLSSRLQGGRLLAVFAMGGLSALIVGPCVAAPLAGALVYISRTQDMWLGGAALFSLATGMSVPLLVVGLSASSWLPRAGRWMERVKHFFGALLLVVALWMVAPVLPPWALMLLLAALGLTAAVSLGAFEPLDTRTPAAALAKGLGLGLSALALLQLLGAASGGADVLQPLRQWTVAPGEARGKTLSFETIDSLPALHAAVSRSARPVMVDFYADWCTACKEMEVLTFNDSDVRQRMAGFKLLRVDVSANTAQHQALMRKYQVFGPPALLFFAPAGAELAEERVVGYKTAAALRAQLDKLVASGG